MKECVQYRCHKSQKKSILSLNIMPHIHSFDYRPFAKFYSNETLNSFDSLKNPCLTSQRKKVLFFLLATVLEVEKKRDRSVSLRHRALHCPQLLCAVSVPLDVSPCSGRALLFCSVERSTGVCRAPSEQGRREADNSHSWGSESTVTASSTSS